MKNTRTQTLNILYSDNIRHVVIHHVLNKILFSMLATNPNKYIYI